MRSSSTSRLPPDFPLRLFRKTRSENAPQAPCYSYVQFLVLLVWFYGVEHLRYQVEHLRYHVEHLIHQVEHHVFYCVEQLLAVRLRISRSRSHNAMIVCDRPRSMPNPLSSSRFITLNCPWSVIPVMSHNSRLLGQAYPRLRLTYDAMQARTNFSIGGSPRISITARTCSSAMLD
jgi:hypothetical protein